MESTDKNIRFVNTECSPSHSYNNMTESEDKIYYIHNSEIQPRIIVIDKKLFEASNKDNLVDYITKLNSNEVLQYSCLKKININGKEFIAVGLFGGFKIWSLDGLKLLLHSNNTSIINFKSYSVHAVSERRYKTNNRFNNSILFGDSHGLITSCSLVNETFQPIKFHQHKKDLTVTALTTNYHTGIVVSAYDNGQIIILEQSDKEVTEIQTFDNEYNLPVLSLISLDNININVFVAGYLNGEIRIFSYNNLHLMYIYQAHLKSITSLSVFDNYFVSTSEDCYVNVYKMEKDKFEVVKNIFLENKIPVGGIITKIKGKNSLIVCNFDNPVLAVYDEVI